MHDGRRLVLLENSLHAAEVGDIANFQRTPLHGFAMTAGKVVVGYRQISGLRQRFARVAADEFCGARDEDIQDCSNSVRSTLSMAIGSDEDRESFFPASELVNAEPKEKRGHQAPT